jgi:hypothetical protein
MKHFALAVTILCAFSALGRAGTEYSGKEMKQSVLPSPCPEWYADKE